MWQIKKELLDSIAEASKNTYPDEFIALLSGNREEKTIDHLVLLKSTYGDSFSSIWLNQKPVDFSIIGSVHSHPGKATPSGADIRFFPKTGEIHIIAGYPYDLDSFRFFDSAGKKAEVELI